MSYISTGNTTTTAFKVGADTTGNLVFATGGANTTALTLTNTQAATFANTVTVTGALTATGGVTVGSSAAPAFSAYPTTVTTSLPNATYTAPIAVDTKQFDTASCFNASNATVGGIPAYAFKPTTAGYYQIIGSVNWGSGAGSSNYLGINKNGTEFIDGPYVSITGSTVVTINALLSLNGTTDYIQFGVYQNSGSTRTTGTSIYQFYFQGFLARSA